MSAAIFDASCSLELNPAMTCEVANSQPFPKLDTGMMPGNGDFP